MAQSLTPAEQRAKLAEVERRLRTALADVHALQDALPQIPVAYRIAVRAVRHKPSTHQGDDNGVLIR